MSLQYDLVTARNLCRELEQSCQEVGVEFANELLVGVGKENWVKMLRNNQEDFLAYLRATPSQRKRKAAWKGDRMQIVLSVGALLFARRAVHYLEIAVAIDEQRSNTSREAVTKTAELALEREGIPRSLWPFPGKSPFER